MFDRLVSTTSRALAVGFLTAIVAFAGLAYRANTVVITSPESAAPFAPAFRGERSGPGAMLNAHDGQAFGSLALDPLLSHPDGWLDGREELAYRAARPLLGWLVMATSWGSTTAAAWSLLAWTAIGIGMMAVATVVLAGRWGRQSDWVPLMILLPGVAGQILHGGLCDGLAAGLALFGLAWWLDGRDRWAIAALCLAALARETTLLVPLALLLATERRRALRLLLPVGAYVAWLGVIWWRLRALPMGTDESRLGLPPANFVTAIARWDWIEVLAAGSILVFGIVAWRRAPSREVRWLVLLSALFAATLGPVVLSSSWDFTRPLLPVTLIGACLMAPRTDAGSPDHQLPLHEPARLRPTVPVR